MRRRARLKARVSGDNRDGDGGDGDNGNGIQIRDRGSSIYNTDVDFVLDLPFVATLFLETQVEGTFTTGH